MAGSTARAPSSSAASAATSSWSARRSVKGHDMGREIRLVRALADEGFQYALNDGEPPTPRDRWSTSRAAASLSPSSSCTELEAGGRAGDHVARQWPDEPGRGPRLRLLMPGDGRGAVVERHGGGRASAYRAEAEAWRQERIAAARRHSRTDG